MLQHNRFFQIIMPLYVIGLDCSCVCWDLPNLSNLSCSKRNLLDFDSWPYSRTYWRKPLTYFLYPYFLRSSSSWHTANLKRSLSNAATFSKRRASFEFSAWKNPTRQNTTQTHRWRLGAGFGGEQKIFNFGGQVEKMRV